jgi:hypothetical protein
VTQPIANGVPVSKFLGADGVVNFDVDNHAALGVHDSACQRNLDDPASSRHGGRAAEDELEIGARIG